MYWSVRLLPFIIWVPFRARTNITSGPDFGGSPRHQPLHQTLTAAVVIPLGDNKRFTPHHQTSHHRGSLSRFFSLLLLLQCMTEH